MRWVLGVRCAGVGRFWTREERVASVSADDAEAYAKEIGPPRGPGRIVPAQQSAAARLSELPCCNCRVVHLQGPP